jgi:L-lactate dehydrogenase complex protein LldG
LSASKEKILEAIRRNRPAPADLPDLHRTWSSYSDARAKFIEMVEAVGGKVITSRDRAELNEQLQRLPHVAGAQKVVSLVPSVGLPNVEWDTIRDSHDLASVDVAIMPGQFGVAENGAVWCTDRDISYRVLYFLCQHLVLVVSTDAIVDHMHSAYERIATTQKNGKPTFSEPAFGVFISGPSKTADIEQQLVIGAHGPRSLMVCLLDQ